MTDEEKRIAALEWLGERWLLHPKHVPASRKGVSVHVPNLARRHQSLLDEGPPQNIFTLIKHSLAWMLK